MCVCKVDVYERAWLRLITKIEYILCVFSKKAHVSLLHNAFALNRRKVSIGKSHKLEDLLFKLLKARFF